MANMIVKHLFLIALASLANADHFGGHHNIFDDHHDHGSFDGHELGHHGDVHHGGLVKGGGSHGFHIGHGNGLVHGLGGVKHGHGGAKHGGGGYGKGQDYYAPAKYAFGYGVNDPYHGTNFGHSESRDGPHAKGQYYVNLPDGRLQKVSYYTDEWGYHPTITYEGKAHFPSHGKKGGYH